MSPPLSAPPTLPFFGFSFIILPARIGVPSALTANSDGMSGRSPDSASTPFAKELLSGRPPLWALKMLRFTTASASAPATTNPKC